MMSAAPQKRMVSSVFITLTSPQRAKITPTAQVHSTMTQDAPQSMVSVSPGSGSGEVKFSTTSQTPRHTSATSQEGNYAWTSSPSPFNDNLPPSPCPPSAARTVPGDRVPQKGNATCQLPKQQEIKPQEFFLPPPPPLSPLDLELSADPVSPLPPPPLHISPAADPQHALLKARDEQRATDGKPFVESPPSAGGKKNEPAQKHEDNCMDQESKDVCGFCRKPVLTAEAAIEALNRTYHGSCFQCRQCHTPLAGKLYYNKAGIPLCEDCYQASLEPCWACGEVIKDQVIRALERAYHPPCFVCTTCSQPIGEQRFAQGEVGEVYCLQDYYRKYAPQCNVCTQLIIPREDGTDSYTVECLGRCFHEDCYRCEVCRILLSPEPNEHGCHPLDGQILCKTCHLTQIQRAQH
ncbi:filamin-binding LIM protein 1 isoform X2 [Denticeps clupeoides]|uniref:LIM zinc-binding domain-containing protein n=1 Tax=Denticeps clupeoides TaxID=299321 RepID=A0AAY4AYR5_9TELE|nr:filamin-binding LIM protein 1 isoform X2 [Denticeps clupeoides]